MLTYPLTKTGGVSLYEQLYRCIKADILTGRLAAGRSCPPSGRWPPIWRSASLR